MSIIHFKKENLFFYLEMFSYLKMNKYVERGEPSRKVIELG